MHLMFPRNTSINISRAQSTLSKSIFWGIIIAASFFITSCMTMADYDFSTVEQYTAQGDFTKAESIVSQDSSRIYSDHDEVLSFLDKGMLLHFAGSSVDSNKSLSMAEQKIFANYSKSVTQGIGSYVANDTVIDYAGDTYEDVYTNIFMALNYLNLDDTENAMVEIRRFDNKLKEVSSKYQSQIAQLQQQVNNGSQLSVETIEFHNSALARYLSMLMYREANDYASADVDIALLKSAFATESDIYNFPIPLSIDEELTYDSSLARINLLAFNGRAPIKSEQTVEVASPIGDYYKIAYPVMQKRISSISAIRMTVQNEATGETIEAKAEKLESVENIALDTFKQNQSIIYSRALVRSLLKATTTTAFGVMEQNASNKDDANFYRMLRTFSEVANSLTERADVRTSRYFPAAANIAGVTVEPGLYSITVSYLTDTGAVIAFQKTEHFAVAAHKLNLIESVCLR